MPEESVRVVGCQRIDGILPHDCVLRPAFWGNVREHVCFKDIGGCEGDASGVEDGKDAMCSLVGVRCHLNEGDLQHEVLNEVLCFRGRQGFGVYQCVEHRACVVVDSTHGWGSQRVCVDVEE